MALTLVEYMNMGRLPSAVSLPTAPDAPITRMPSGRAWACTAGEHGWHRNENAAKWCAWRVLPFDSVSLTASRATDG